MNVNTKNFNINASENMNVNVGSVLKTIPTTKVAEEERAQDASMAECLAAASASAQHGFGKFFKAQL